MLTWIKKHCLIVCTCSVLVCTPGCIGNANNDYHNGVDKEWLTEQVQKGKLTQEQADAIWKQQQELGK